LFFFLLFQAFDNDDRPFAICTAANPTPPAAAVTKIHSPEGHFK
jgi:hypothetical protein